MSDILDGAEDVVEPEAYSVAKGSLFYEFFLERHVPAKHRLRGSA